MGIENHNSIYVCCQRHKKPFIEKEVRRKYKYSKIVSNLKQADLILIIGEESKTMKKEIKQANELSILIEYQNIDILPEHTKKNMINAREPEGKDIFPMDELE